MALSPNDSAGSELTIDEALGVLGLQPGATKDQIDAAYIELSPSAHPDTGGSTEAFIRLTEARDTALGSRIQSSMVPVDLIRVILSAGQEERQSHQREREQERKQEAAKAESKRVTSNIVMSSTRKYRELRRRAALFGSISLGLTVLETDILPRFGESVPQFPGSEWLFAILTAMLGIRFWVLSNQAEDISQSVEDFSERLSERSFCLHLIHSIARQMVYDSAASGQSWGRLEWYRGIRGWVARTADLLEQMDEEDRPPSRARLRVRLILHRLRLQGPWCHLVHAWRFMFGVRLKATHELAEEIGYDDFRRLLMAKGIEHGIIEEVEVQGSDRPMISYSLAKSKAVSQ